MLQHYSSLPNINIHCFFFIRTTNRGKQTKRSTANSPILLPHLYYPGWNPFQIQTHNNQPCYTETPKTRRWLSMTPKHQQSQTHHHFRNPRWFWALAQFLNSRKPERTVYIAYQWVEPMWDWHEILLWRKRLCLPHWKPGGMRQPVTCLSLSWPWKISGLLDYCWRGDSVR